MQGCSHILPQGRPVCWGGREEGGLGAEGAGRPCAGPEPSRRGDGAAARAGVSPARTNLSLSSCPSRVSAGARTSPRPGAEENTDGARPESEGGAPGDRSGPARAGGRAGGPVRWGGDCGPWPMLGL